MAEQLTLREWRRRKGLTQGELAKELGVATNTVSRIEAGEREPRPATLKAIYRYFGIDGSQFRWEPGPRHILNRQGAGGGKETEERRAA